MTKPTLEEKESEGTRVKFGPLVHAEIWKRGCP
jgi:hypothetical protein